MSGCPYCAGGCRDSDFGALLAPELTWLWEQVAAAADRRGDPEVVAGRLTVTAPADPAARNAAVGLLGGAPLRAGVRRSVDLAELSARLASRVPGLTPGTVAAHALRRPLAGRAAARREREVLLRSLEHALTGRLAELPEQVRVRLDVAGGWERLRTTGWAARLAAQPDPDSLVGRAVDVLAALPEPPRRADRRTLVPADPHALDDGTPLAGLVLALAGLAGIRSRAAWDAVGVDCDDLTGGLLALGIHPVGWTLPADAVVTVPPRELGRCTWPGPAREASWVFVTENPSVTAAAAVLAADPDVSVRLLCTVGTPSAVEVAAIGRLADAGWRIAVRADFDRAGLAHVRAVLGACPSATPWRMAAADYRRALSDDAPGALPRDLTGDVVRADVVATDAPWDPDLVAAMNDVRRPAFEEALLADLLADLAAGRPASR